MIWKHNKFCNNKYKQVHDIEKGFTENLKVIIGLTFMIL